MRNSKTSNNNGTSANLVGIIHSSTVFFISLLFRFDSIRFSAPDRFGNGVNHHHTQERKKNCIRFYESVRISSGRCAVGRSGCDRRLRLFGHSESVSSDEMRRDISLSRQKSLSIEKCIKSKSGESLSTLKLPFLISFAEASSFKLPKITFIRPHNQGTQHNFSSFDMPVLPRPLRHIPP